MNSKFSILFLLAFWCVPKMQASKTIYLVPVAAIDSCNYSIAIAGSSSDLKDHRPNPIIQLIRKKHLKNKRIIAAILAFPFPFGIVGLHRIYLGTAPYVPIVYIATFGGVLGILPFIDFCVLALDKETDRYLNNKKIFMWIND